jgi:hypothetical protein
MKVVVFSESPADEAAIRILVDALLGTSTEPIQPPRLESRRGFGNLEKLLPTVFKHVYYRTDAAGLVVVADSNGSPLHTDDHEGSKFAANECRLCRLRASVHAAQRQVAPVPGRGPLGVAIGLACPAVEAWYHCGADPHATEAAWARDLAAGASAPQYIRELKSDVYGTDRPCLALETAKATEAARRLAGNLDELERHFPAGFGSLARDVRGWECSG